MNLSELKKIILYITGRHPSCLHEFTEKEIITFFTKAGIERDRIIYHQSTNNSISTWLVSLLREIQSKTNFAQVIKKLLSEVKFYNPEAEIYLKSVEESISASNKVGVFLDFSKERDYLFKNIFVQAAKNVELEAIRVSELTNPGEDIYQNIQKMIKVYKYFIVDISDSGKNKFVELGQLIALSKKIVLLKEEGHERPFNVAHLQMIDYPKASYDTETTEQQNKKLQEKIEKALLDLKNLD